MKYTREKAAWLAVGAISTPGWPACNTIETGEAQDGLLEHRRIRAMLADWV